MNAYCFFNFNSVGLYEIKGTICAAQAERAMTIVVPRRDIIKVLALFILLSKSGCAALS